MINQSMSPPIHAFSENKFHVRTNEQITMGQRERVHSVRNHEVVTKDVGYYQSLTTA